MADLGTLAVKLLNTVTGVNMQNAAGATVLYTVPTGKVCRIVMVVVRDTSATLAGGTDFDFTNWRQTVDLSGMTTANTQYRTILNDNSNSTELAAAATFSITPSTGSTGAATATIDVFGYLT